MPLCKSIRVEAGKVRLTFDHAAGLQVQGGSLREFTVAGADSIFRPAQARLDGNSVVVWREQVRQPVAVRFN